ncbi:MAG: bifunctional DNA-formamidopyrimidine glycosylase/DNA-(apurinic or apyrimidinic site) lyase, partial [Candidatus Omnitrophica bacterium]|nr:bifunctional DNA-formamidopyrimidine glycosylase/DNA-(apurinic or apyrimidinic site) lyase [Candidatus Omnitrophota bacterium]
MPELPEVETISRDLDSEIRGLSIREVEVLDARVVRGISDKEFSRRLAGRKVSGVSRRGKALLIDLGGLFLLVQPMMTGQLIVSNGPESKALARATRVVFRLSKGRTLVYNDQRLFGRLTVVAQPDESEHVRSLGPEPLEPDFTADVLKARLKGKNAPVKVVLLDGKCVAGIGNIYASEILFCAGIHPARKAAELGAAELNRLWKATREVLAEAVRLRGTSMRDYRDGHGRKGGYLEVVRVYGRD